MPVPEAGTKAFLKNPELKQEREILQASKLYALTDSSTAEVTVNLKNVRPLISDVPPGGVMFIVLTLGLVPVNFPDRYVYKFTERNRETGEVTRYDMQLKVAQQTWLLNAFRDTQSKNAKLGEAMRAKIISEQESTVGKRK
jgi:hypothetical protein